MKYTDLMYSFSHSELKAYLGKNIINTLIEWMPESESLLTRGRLVSMIDSLYGTEILKDKSFRKNLLLSMQKKDVYYIRDNYLSGSDKQQQDPAILAEIIANKPWSGNRLSLYLAKIWEISESVFEKKKDDTVVTNTITSPERFYELLDYQYYIKQRVMNNLTSGTKQERMLVHMPTGTGKTKTTMHIISSYLTFNLNKKGIVIWVAHTIELLQQAYDTFVNVWHHLGDGDITAFKLWGNHNIDDVSEPLNGIVFCGLQKLMNIYDRNPELMERLKKDCRLVVFDEAHKAAAEKTQKVIESLMRMPAEYENRALIGLSATPGRTTEDSYDNNLLNHMFAGKLISIDSTILNQINMGRLQALNSIAERNIIRYFQERRILSKLDVERLQYKKEFTVSELKVLKGALRNLGYREKDFSEKQLQVFASNADRNKEIMKKLRELHLQKVPTIVFACSVDHARMLSAMLSLEEIPNCMVVGDMDPMDRQKAIDTFKDRSSGVDIIINYEVLTTGFDSKNIRCVFITRPTKSIVLYSQMIGRGLRGPLMGGNERCLLVDVDDNLNLFNSETAFSHFDDYWHR